MDRARLMFGMDRAIGLLCKMGSSLIAATLLLLLLNYHGFEMCCDIRCSFSKTLAQL
jgi:hypothetical protein